MTSLDSEEESKERTQCHNNFFKSGKGKNGTEDKIDKIVRAVAVKAPFL